MESASFAIDTFICIIYFHTQMPRCVCIYIYTHAYVCTCVCILLPRVVNVCFILHYKYEG